ncbi:MAG: type II toxin-antitoxin system HicA family toxin [Ardenticatenaceae bacterium]
MARLTPISRRKLIRRLTKLGFTGPYVGGRHEFMLRRGKQRLILPNPHQGDISAGLLARILRRANITREEWESTV